MPATVRVDLGPARPRARGLRLHVNLSYFKKTMYSPGAEVSLGVLEFITCIHYNYQHAAWALHTATQLARPSTYYPAAIGTLKAYQ